MEWLNLAIAVIPSALIWVWKSGGKDKDQEHLSEAIKEFRAENKEQAESLKDDIQAQLSQMQALEMRVTKLEEFRHRARNDLQILAGHVDDLRVRRM